MMNIYSIFDASVQSYFQPFCFTMDTEAMRAFEGAIREKNSNLHMFPQDFALYRIGTFDPETGKLDSIQEPVRVITATEIKRSMLNQEQQQKDLDAQLTTAQEDMQQHDPYLSDDNVNS